MKFALVILLICQSAFGTIIQSSNVIPWVPGLTIGVQGGIPNRTTIIDVTKYGADPTATTDSSSSINAAISAANSTSNVVFFPAGTYLISDNIFCDKSSVTLRGALKPDGTPAATLCGYTNGSKVLSIGHDENSSIFYGITNGWQKGSTTLMMTNVDFLSAGDMLLLSQKNGSDSNLNVISTGNFNRVQAQQIVVSAVNGLNVTTTTPLVTDFVRSPAMLHLGITPKFGIGIENLKFTCTNELTGQVGPQQWLLGISMVRDSWITNCEFYFANNYHVVMSDCVGVEMRHCKLTRGVSIGSNHGGLLFNASSCFIYDNIIAEGLQPGIEFGGGAGNAFVGNFMTNNILEIDCHGAHPCFNLWEENVGDHVLLDGYFGSVSQQTFFRNKLISQYATVTFRRWSTHMQVVGNVLGQSGNSYSNYVSEDNGSAWSIFNLGKPNIGNESYSGTNPPISWNFPGHTLSLFDGPTWTNGMFTFTNNQLNTNLLIGNFTNVPAPLSAGYPIIFQDGTDTNIYWPDDGTLLSVTAGTSSNLLVNRNISVSNGWTVYVAGQNQYQQLQKANRSTDTFHGNYDFFNNAVTWDAGIADHVIPTSLIYTNGAPSWWSANRWPAIDTLNGTMVMTIPAQDRYNGQQPASSVTAVFGGGVFGGGVMR